MTQDPYPKGKLQALQDEIKKKLEKVSELSETSVFNEQSQDIENEIERALGTVTEKDGKCGVCIIVLTPRGRSSKPNLPGPYFDSITILVRIVESVIINQSATGTGKPASWYAERVAHGLHHFQTTDKKTVVCTDITLVPDEQNLIYDVSFRTEIGLGSAQT